ncbi:hypothetical protein J2T13_004955 [Paenibacillus sp. DS2015]
MSETPLGVIVGIRSEKDSKTIKSFNSEQKKIHSDWKKRIADKKLLSPEIIERDMAELERMLESMFGGGKS